MLGLLEQAGGVSTQTLPAETKGSQTEPLQDDAAVELKDTSHERFSLSAYDSDDDEADFFPNTDLAQHSLHEVVTEQSVQ